MLAYRFFPSNVLHFVCVGPENAAQKLLVFDLDGILCDRSLKKKAHRLLKTYRDFDEHPFVARSRPYLAALVKFLKVSQNCGFPHAMLPLFACLVTFCEVDQWFFIWRSGGRFTHTSK